MTMSKKKQKLSVTLLIAALVGVLVLTSVSAFGWIGNSGNSGSGGASDPAASADEPSKAQKNALLALARRDAKDPYAMGKTDAPVVMIEYADFQCSFCGKFARDTKPELVKKYVDEGVLRIEWRQFPIFGKESETAALAGYAAGQQGKFWDFHDVAYGEERRKNSGAFAQDKVEAMAREAGVPDLDRFVKDMKSEDARTAVNKDTGEGYNLGVSSTPAFLVNGQPVLGAQPAEVFTSAIEQARKAAAE
ncbi:DsbA family protein [Streptomyces gobiensis]|uniref:DsbA family protein n=1 Tax=Streptomyces gobiensis TaxID=2875706 RepID=UPI001E625B76|nr:thioredoxin domain-containing protein [Streptomyces gobiensis]UGY91972.1 DsbA family protein [Streptomyces gobiensis]